MPDAGVELTITVRQEGAEAAQAQVQQLRQGMQTVRTEASLTDKITSMSLSKFILATSIIVNIGMATFDVLGVAIDNAVQPNLRAAAEIVSVNGNNITGRCRIG